MAFFFAAGYPGRMGRTLPPAAMQFQLERQKLRPFQRALSPIDQRLVDDLFVYANHHIAEMAYAANPLPFQSMLLAMLLEQHKEVMELRKEIEEC
jgi:type II secretory pathway component PulL